jgi:hypothetical protein
VDGGVRAEEERANHLRYTVECNAPAVPVNLNQVGVLLPANSHPEVLRAAHHPRSCIENGPTGDLVRMLPQHPCFSVE